MKLTTFIFSLLLFHCFEISHAQQWQLFTASDAVSNFVRYHNDIWTISGSGLSKVNMQTGETETWNIINSNLPDYNCHQMSIDSNGTIWMASDDLNTPKLIRFDGTDFETLTHINGEKIRIIYAIETTPDGKVWIHASTNKRTLFLYDQNQYIPIALPSDNFLYVGYFSNLGTDSNSHVWTYLKDTSLNQTLVGEYDGLQWTVHDVSAFSQEVSSGDAWTHDQMGNIYLLIRSRLSAPKLITYNGLVWKEIGIPSTATEAKYIDHPLFIDHQNRIWLSLSNNTFQRYDGNSWTEILLSNFGLTNGQPDKLLFKDQNKWWLLFDKYDDPYSIRSLYHWDGIEIKQVTLGNSSIPSNSVGDVIVDELNNKWLSSHRSLLKFNGETWISIHAPNENYYPWPIGSNHNGGVWLYPLEPYVSQFDGVTFSNTLLFDVEGTPLDYFGMYKVDHQGRFLLANAHANILVHDHGHTIYLDSLFFEGHPGEFYMDFARDVAADSSGRIYAIGYDLYRLEQDSSWTNIPLWDSWAYGYRLFVSPENKIWVFDGNVIPFEFKYWIYDGVQWNETESANQFGWEPKWDLNGNPWFLSQAGLCKYENELWFCYDRANSPLIQHRISSFSIDDYNNIWVTQDNGGLLVFNEYHIQHINGTESPLLNGYIYRDINQNGVVDDTDTPLASHRVLLLPENAIAFSNLSGTYQLSSSAGGHEVKYLPRPNWHIDNSPSSYNINVGLNSISGLDFNVVPDQEVTDLQLYLNEGFPRCGQWSNYWLSFRNFGTMSASGVLTFIKDPDTEIGSIYPLPSWIAGDTLTWTFSDLIPFESEQISLEVLIPVSPGSILNWQGSLDLNSIEGVLRVDSFHIQQEVRCSFDPNDKISRTVRSAGNGQSYLNDPLLYTIRFQNTGNDTAFNVIIRDTLDTDLDLNTLEIISASHPYEAFLKQDRTLEFRFINIMLPDSSINELASHGFVTYMIKAKSDLTTLTIVENTAHIYFDFNTAVITNTAINELIKFSTGLFHEPTLVSLLRAHPNPTSDIIFIQSLTRNPNVINFSLITSHGQSLQSGLLHPGETTQLSLADYPTGIYILRASNNTGMQSITIVKG